MKAPANKRIYLVATCDTKGLELEYCAHCIRNLQLDCVLVDVSTTTGAVKIHVDVRPEQVLGSRRLPSGEDRGACIEVMSQGLTDYLQQQWASGHVAGVLGLGGSGGTSLISRALRELPIGLPKLMVSTVASGNTAPYVGCSDTVMMYSVVDVAGLNTVSRTILANAAHAMAGMAMAPPPLSEAKPAIGMTMFGVTTPCVTGVREKLELHGYDGLVFHATGTGGQAMERLVASELIEGVLDITTTEVADEIVGGVFPAGPQRFDATLKRGLPLVLSFGACDMVNFGAQATVPSRFKDRKLHVHNAQVTLMRTSPEENCQIAAWICRKLNSSSGPVTVVIPEKGVSMLDQPGQPFYDPEADAALFDEVERLLATDAQRQLRSLPLHINEPEFAQALVDEFLALAKPINSSRCKAH
ncbi:MAG: Tm-1-like ATP-binding domain-containing protein [Planctomycetales bacterium]|nr:Tm-1-like ATP-binding domain-containing protein [Planctomycetales bacterium]